MYNVSRALCRTGRGFPVVVIHGGPGFDHKYLRHSLSFLEDTHELCFFDQLGCGSNTTVDRAVTLQSTAEHLVQILSWHFRKSEFAVLAHSWGSLVLAAALSQTDERNPLWDSFRGGLLVNPVPLVRRSFDSAYKAFLDRIPATIRLDVESTAARTGDGTAVMRMLWPYYGDGIEATMPADFQLSLPAYSSVIGNLDEFDYRSTLGRLKLCAVLTAEHDFTAPELISDVLTVCRRQERISDAGHFPMMRNREVWKASIKVLLQDGVLAQRE